MSRKCITKDFFPEIPILVRITLCRITLALNQSFLNPLFLQCLTTRPIHNLSFYYYFNVAPRSMKEVVMYTVCTVWLPSENSEKMVLTKPGSGETAVEH